MGAERGEREKGCGRGKGIERGKRDAGRGKGIEGGKGLWERKGGEGERDAEGGRRRGTGGGIEYFDRTVRQ